MGILSAGRQKSEQRKKPDQLLSSVVRETAIPAAVELLKANQQFAYPNGRAWVALLLEGAAIGGLSRRHSRDEAKGSIVELIEDDQIHTVATAEMLASDVFGIIPTASTLDRMSEYSLLTGAAYTWAVLWQSDNTDLVIDPVGPATFEEAVQVQAGTLSLEDVAGREAWLQNGGQSRQPEDPGLDGADDDDDMVGEVTDEEPDWLGGGTDDEGGEPVFGDDDAAPVFGDETVAMDLAALADEGAEGAQEVQGSLDSSDSSDSPDSPDSPDDGDYDAATQADFVEPEGDDLYIDDVAVHSEHAEHAEHPDDLETEPGFDEGADNVDHDILLADEEAVRGTIARRFLAEDLSLELDLEEFNTAFGVGAAVVHFDVPESVTGWLGEQVAQQARQANVELEALRDANHQSLRALYVDLMGQHMLRVTADVSTQKPGTVYHGLTEAAAADHAAQQARADQEISQARRQIEDEFEKAAADRGEQARAQAVVQYKERNRAHMERRIAEVGTEHQRLAEERLTHSKQTIADLQRRDAQTKFEIGQTKVFSLLAEQQAQQLSAERELVQKWNAQMTSVIEAHRTDDINRTQALLEQQARMDEVARLEAAQVRALEAVRAEHQARIAQMHADMDRARAEATAELEARGQQWQEQLAAEQSRLSAAESRNEHLHAELDQLETSMRRRYERKLEALEEDNDFYSDELDHSEYRHSRAMRVLTAMAFLVAVLMLAVGVILGVAIAN